MAVNFPPVPMPVATNPLPAPVKKPDCGCLESAKPVLADGFSRRLSPPPVPLLPEPPGGMPHINLPPPLDLSGHFVNMGERFYRANRFREAINAFSTAIQLNSQNFVAFNKRGVARATLKDYAGAMADYTQAIAIQPGFYNAYVNRGNLRVYVKDYCGALIDYNMAIRLDPWSTVAYENRSEVFSTLGRNDLSLQDKAVVIRIRQMKKPAIAPLPLSYCPKRVALVLANDDYPGRKHDLGGGPMNDAESMAAMLRSQGFDVLTGYNLTGAQTKGKVAELINLLNRNPGAISLIYYSGHGGAIRGNNYLIPADYDGTVGPEFEQNAVSVDYLLKALKPTNTLFNMIFLDACRTPLQTVVPQPYYGGAIDRQAVLKQWESEPGPGLSNVWIEYAARPEEAALQDGNEGLYTKYLLQFMARPDLNLKDVSMYTSFALEQDPIAARQGQHARTQSDLSQTEAIAEAFSFARPCSPSAFKPVASQPVQPLQAIPR